MVILDVVIWKLGGLDVNPEGLIYILGIIV